MKACTYINAKDTLHVFRGRIPRPSGVPRFVTKNSPKKHSIESHRFPLAMAAHTCNPTTEETEAGQLPGI